MTNTTTSYSAADIVAAFDRVAQQEAAAENLMSQAESSGDYRYADEARADLNERYTEIAEQAVDFLRDLLAAAQAAQTRHAVYMEYDGPDDDTNDELRWDFIEEAAALTERITGRPEADVRESDEVARRVAQVDIDADERERQVRGFNDALYALREAQLKKADADEVARRVADLDAATINFTAKLGDGIAAQAAPARCDCDAWQHPSSTGIGHVHSESCPLYDA